MTSKRGDDTPSVRHFLDPRSNAILRRSAPFAVIALVLAFLPTTPWPFLAIRGVLGFVFVLWLPGFTFLRAIFANRPLEGLNGLLLSLAASSLIVAAIGYTLNFLSWGLSPLSIALSLGVVILLAIIAGEIRSGSRLERSRGPVVKALLSLWQGGARWLTVLVIAGTLVRMFPIFALDTFLDLDPYNHLMKAEALLAQGHIPSWDPLSAAPGGTAATYTIIPLGFEFVAITIHVITQATLLDSMRFLPLVFGAGIAAALYLLTREVTNSTRTAFIAASFAAFPVSWLLTYEVGGNPVGEDLGIFLFVLGLMLLRRIAATPTRSTAVELSIVLSAMFYVHQFSVFYFAVVALTYLLARSRSISDLKRLVECLGFAGGLTILLSLPVLAMVIPSSAGAGVRFSQSALTLAFASDSYLVVTWQNLPLLLAVVYLPLSLCGLLIVISSKGPHLTDRALLASWFLALLCMVLLPDVTVIRGQLATLPFGATMIFEHRVMSYLILASSPLIAITLDRIASTTGIAGLRRAAFHEPSSKPTSPVPALHARILRAGATLLVLSVVGANVVASGLSSYDLAASPTAQYYARLFAWMSENMSAKNVSLINNWDLAMWARAVVSRPTVFSHVYQDLVAPDAPTRMRLHAFLFDPDSYDCVRAVQLLILFNVTYVVVAAHPVYVNVLSNRWIWSIPDLAYYVGWMDAKRFVRPVFAVGNLVWVYKVEDLGSPTVCA